MPGASHGGPLPPLGEDGRLLRDRLGDHVVMLGGTIGERNIWLPAKLEASANYIDKTLAEMGLAVSSQRFAVDGAAHGASGRVEVRNIDAELPGGRPGREIVLLGAHYDSVLGSTGANDNGSGVAALLELARLLRDQKLERTVRLVGFVNEEPPFFQTREMGSRLYAARSRRRGEKITAMYSLETIGYYTDERGSQKYPPPFSFFYPDIGNFIGFVANISSRALLRRSIASFRKRAAFPSQGAAIPGWVMGVSWSDHWSFWEEGYPALMITDTAPFRYPYYHSSEDTPDKLDYDRLARVVAGLALMVRDVAGQQE
jgi:Zn-dependent M28 family amino/carboxypeptidase